MVIRWICVWKAASGSESLTGIHWLPNTFPERHLPFAWLAYLAKILLLSDNCCTEMSLGASLWQLRYDTQLNWILVMMPRSKIKVPEENDDFISEIKEAKLIEDPIKLKFCGFPFNQAHVEFENTEFCKNMGWTIFYSHFPHVHTMYLLWMNNAFI